MTFTESDAQNDGLIKREVGREMVKVAKTQNPEMFEHFQNVCDEVGRDPADVFGEMCVRALNSETYAHNVLDSEINMSQIRADEIRLEDVKYVKQLSEELGLDEGESSQDPIDKLIEQRLEMVTQSPLDNLRKSRENPEGVNGEVLSHMEQLQSEINSLKGQIEGQDEQSTTTTETSEHNEQSVDELFGGDEQDSDNKNDNGISTSDTVEMGDEGVGEEEIGGGDVQQDGASTEKADGVGTGEEEEESVDEMFGETEGESITEEEIEEAFEGTDTTVDEQSTEESESNNPFDEDYDDGSDDDNPFVTSEDGEQE